MIKIVVLVMVKVLVFISLLLFSSILHNTACVMRKMGIGFWESIDQI